MDHRGWGILGARRVHFWHPMIPSSKESLEDQIPKRPIETPQMLCEFCSRSLQNWPHPGDLLHPSILYSPPNQHNSTTVYKHLINPHQIPHRISTCPKKNTPQRFRFTSRKIRRASRKDPASRSTGTRSTSSSFKEVAPPGRVNFPRRCIPSRGLTYPTLGKGKSSSNPSFGGYVSSLEGNCKTRFRVLNRK